MERKKRKWKRDFNPRSPRGGATCRAGLGSKSMGISIHAPHEGERRWGRQHHRSGAYFNPRSPRGGATVEYFGDGAPVVGISIHAPHEGERPAKERYRRIIITFQSTLPTRGSDAPHSRVLRCQYYFNPRSPRGGATPIYKKITIERGISIHAPHEGERPAPRCGCWYRLAFQSTLPTRGSDADFVDDLLAAGGISIHAPHEGERHYTVAAQDAKSAMISIHAPHEGERRYTK